MMTTATADGFVLQGAVDVFDDLIGRHGDHHIRCGSEDYLQPYVYLSFHLISMRVAGWTTDFDELGVVSGASALFAHQPRDFMCKYAHLAVDPDRRIAEATGFGYEWIEFTNTEGAWRLIRDSVDAGKPVKGWDWENVLFVGYRDADPQAERAVFAMADGPSTYARWWTWAELGEWVERMRKWKTLKLGRFAGTAAAQAPEEVARRVLAYLAAWSHMPPEAVQDQYPAATFGLSGMAAYAANCANVSQFETWTMCHDINGQWTLRNSTAVYLRRLALQGLLGESATAPLEAAAASYRTAYETWASCYTLLGHGATDTQRRDASRRLDVARRVRKARLEERQAVSHLRTILERRQPIERS